MKKMNRKKMKLLLSLGLSSFLTLSLGNPLLPAENTTTGIKALILTGQNTHNWAKSSLVLKKVLEDTGLFIVDMVVSPPEGESLSTFAPDFSGYQVILLDYCGEIWPRRTQKAFMEYVQSGGGVVVYHNSGNAFQDWPEYIQIIGLGGGNRGQEAGPFLYWEDDGLAEDKSEGFAGHHGLELAFPVDIRDKVHPITADLPQRWMHAEDELYSLMRGQAKNLRILGTAYSDPLQGGTGRHEPVLFVNSYGKGKIFHTTLGHAAGEGPFPALECAGFIVTLQRGAEWTATGRVSQTIPPDFPGLTREIPSPADVRRWAEYTSPSLDDILGELALYEYGQGEEILSRLREFIMSCKDSPERRIRCEERLAAFLEGDASLAGKMAVCRYLRLIGTAQCVSILERMLFRKETCDMARFALEKIPGIEAEKALIRSLFRNGREQKLGIIASLGQRKADSAVPELGQLLGISDLEIQVASARALGHIAGSEAAMILTSALGESQGELNFQLATALLNCADKSSVDGDIEQASDLYRRLSGSQFPVSVRAAAMKGLIASDKERSKTIILDALKSTDSDIHTAVISKITEVFEDHDIQGVIDEFSHLPVKSQMALLNVLPHFPKKAVLPTVIEATKSDNEWIQVSALAILGRIGDASVIPLLAGYASRSRGKVRQAARESLWNLSGSEVDHTILLLLIKNADPSHQKELVRCTGDRRIIAGKYILFDLIRTSEDLRLRLEAARNLEKIADPSDLPSLLDLLIGSEEEAEREELRRAVVTVASKIPIRDTRAEAVREMLAEKNDDRVKGELYRVMGGIGDQSVLPLLRFALNKKDSPVYDGAVRAFIDWPDTTVKEDLLWIVQTAEKPLHRVLALRAGLQMAGRDRLQRPASAVEFLQRGLELSERTEERTMVLALLPRFPCAESLKLAFSLLAEESVQEEARLAVQKIMYTLLKNKYYMFH
jgi:HEAT repeat protein